MASARKPPLPSNNSTVNRRSLPPSAATSNRSNRSPTPSTTSSSTTNTPMSRRNTLRDGVPSAHRNSISSPLSARSAAKRPPSDSVSSDAELENAVLLEELRSKLVKTESTAEAEKEEFSKQLKALQMRLDEALIEQSKLEESVHVKDEAIEALEIQVKELTRAKRDQENIYEAERIAAAQEKEELLDREEELNVIIQRLKDQLAQRDKSSEPDGLTARSSLDSSTDESLSFAPSNTSTAPVSNNNLLLQKDKLIESLRLELAEAQIRLAEADHLGGTKLHQLEQQLLETRMTNARLMEDNESFQLLLSSAALNGDFPRGDYLTNAFSEVDPEPESVIVKKVQGSPRNSISLASTLASNLAEELEEANQAETEKYKKLETEIKNLKDSNKAMSLYINNIIERILQHKDSEAILDKTAPLKDDKAAPPPEKEDPQPTGFISRTKSLAVGRKKPNPPPSDSALQRSQSLRSPPNVHKRSQSEATAAYTGTTVVNSIYPNRTSSLFSSGSSEHYTTRSSRPRDSNTSVDSGISDEVTSPSTPTLTVHTNTVGPIVGNKLRPLRLVQENTPSGLVSPVSGGLRKISGDYKEDDEGEKKADRRQIKRSSWMGWFGRGKDEEVSSIAESVVFERKDVE